MSRKWRDDVDYDPLDVLTGEPAGDFWNPRIAPGKRTVTQRLGGRSLQLKRRMAPGKRSLTQALARRSLQFSEQLGPAPTTDDEPEIHDVAQEGVSGEGGELPFSDQIQSLFGPEHDISGIRAHVGGAAGNAAEALGAKAYATGNDVAFSGTPDLHTAAHEAAHVVQQRAGVQLKGGVGAAGDVYERQADAVADAVVRGESASALLGPAAGSTGAAAFSGQRKQTDAPAGLAKEARAILVEAHKYMKAANRWKSQYLRRKDGLSATALGAGRKCIASLDEGDRLVQLAYRKLAHPDFVAAVGPKLQKFFGAAGRLANKFAGCRDSLRQRAGVAWYKGAVPGVEPIDARDSAALTQEIELGHACNRYLRHQLKSGGSRSGLATAHYQEKRKSFSPRAQVYVEYAEAFLRAEDSASNDADAASQGAGQPVSAAERNAQGLSNAELQGGRAGARAQLSQTGLGGAERAELGNNLGALDMESSRRAGPATKATFKPPKSPPATPVEMRNTLEQAIAAGGYARAKAYVQNLYQTAAYEISPGDPLRREMLAAWELGKQQMVLLRADNSQFLSEFDVKAKQRMSTLLSDSDKQVRAELAAYGIPWSTALDAMLDKVVDFETSALFRLGQLGGGGGAAAIMRHIQQSMASASASEAPEKQDHRAELQTVTRELFDLQTSLDALHMQRFQHLSAAVAASPKAARALGKAAAKDTAVKIVGGFTPGLKAIGDARLKGDRLARALRDPSTIAGLDPKTVEQDKQFQAAIARQTKTFHATWITHQADHAILATWRGGAGRSAMQQMATGNADQASQAIAAGCVERLANIKKAQLGLSANKFSPWALPNIVALTKRETSVAPGSMRDRVVSDHATTAQGGDWTDVAIFALTVALAVLAAPLTGGGSLAAAAEVGGLLLDAYLIYGQLEQYDYDKAAAGTHFDQANALSQSDPSLAWLAVEIIFAGVGGAQALKMFKKGAAIKKAVTSGGSSDELVRELNRLGEQSGVGRIGSHVESRHGPGNAHGTGTPTSGDGPGSAGARTPETQGDAEKLPNGQPEASKDVAAGGGSTRVTEQIPGLYESIDPSKTPKGWTISDRPLRTKPDGTVEITTDVVGPNGKSGKMTRQYNPKTGKLTMVEAFFDDDLPRWIDGGTPLRKDKGGTPVFTYLQIRQMRELGIAAGGLKTVKMSTIQNIEAILQLHTLRKADTAMTLEEAILKTHSVQYAETPLVQSGHKIVSAKVSGGSNVAFEKLLTFYEHDSAGNLLEDVVKKHNALLAKYGVTRDDVVFLNYDVELTLRDAVERK